jgi:hypothetical protein
MPTTPGELPQTLGARRQSTFSEDRLAARGVKDELRDNLICKLQRREPDKCARMSTPTTP